MSKMKFNKIHNWADLQEEKRRLNTYLDAKEGLLGERWGRIKKSGRDILYNKIFLPLSVMGVGAVLIRLFRSMADTGNSSAKSATKEAGTQERPHTSTEESGRHGWLSTENLEVMAKAAKILLPVILAAFASDEHEKGGDKEERTTEKTTEEPA